MKSHVEGFEELGAGLFPEFEDESTEPAEKMQLQNLFHDVPAGWSDLVGSKPLRGPRLRGNLTQASPSVVLESDFSEMELKQSPHDIVASLFSSIS